MFMGVFITYPITHQYLVAPALEDQKRTNAIKRSSELRARRNAGEEIDEEELAELEEYLEKDKKKQAKRKAEREKAKREAAKEYSDSENEETTED